MKCLAVCQDERIIRLLARTLKSRLDIEFIVEDPVLGRSIDASYTVEVLPVIA